MPLSVEIEETATCEVATMQGALMQKQFDQGQSVRVKMTFRNNAGALADPTTVVLQIERDADAAFSSYDYDDTSDSSSDYDGIVKDGTGLYHIDLDSSPMSGVWRYRAIGTGAIPAVKQGQFYIIPTAVEDESSSS